MWKHTIPAELAQDRRVAVERGGALLLVSARLREGLAGYVIELTLDDPLGDFRLLPNSPVQAIRAADSRSCRIAVDLDDCGFTLYAEMRRTRDGTVIDLMFDDPGRLFRFTPERADDSAPGRWKNLGSRPNLSQCQA